MQRSRFAERARCGAFTLQEVVGAAGIVGVLAALTFPVFGQMGQRSRLSFCMAGRSQFIRATRMYAEDFDEAWVRRPAALVPYVRPADYSCPTLNYAGPPRFLETRDVVAWRRAHGDGGPGGFAGGTPDLVYHGGPILPSTGTQAIFWGSSWTYSNYKVQGMDLWYAGVGGSSYINTNTEYTGTNPLTGKAAQISTSVSPISSAVIDTSAAPRHAPRTATILNEVCRLYPNPSPYAFYAVYVDTKRGHAGYCAWHSAGSCNGVPIEFAFFFNLDGDPGCDPQDTWTGNPQGLAALGNVTGHELSEAMTDPLLNAWYDSAGAENADKCAWTFGPIPVTFTNSSTWKIQGNWSNAAYDSGGTGSYDGGGCIQTK